MEEILLNNEERKKFWDTLCSFKGENIKEESQLLEDVIKRPQKLYRFRSVSSNSLDGLRSNRLYFSTADRYDDPFDSYLYINWDKVEENIQQSFQSQEERQKIFATIHKLTGDSIEKLSQRLDSHTLNEWTQFGEKVMKQVRQDIQKNQYSICFTEEELNEVLWLKYADNHRGFVMEYDISDVSSFLLISEIEDDNLCQMLNMHYPLHPIFYSDVRYDATDYAKAIVADKIISNFPVSVRSLLASYFKNMYWQTERISLIKRECHMYDKEWRLLYPKTTQIRPSIIRTPNSVTIGLKTKPSDRNLIIALAKEAGIPEIYECIIDRNDNLAKKQIL